MGFGRLRLGAILLFGAAAILTGVGNETGHRVVTALAFALFAGGAVLFLLWRRETASARVLDLEDKTGSDPEDETHGPEGGC